MLSWRRPLAAVVATVLALSAAACGDDDAEDASGSATAAATPAGEPIKIMAADAYTIPANGAVIPFDQGAKARAAAINAAGGIDGRPVEIITCDTQTEPNRTTDCARQAVREKVAAVIGLLATNGQLAVPILDDAGIPSIFNAVNDRLSGTAETVFPFLATATQFSAVPGFMQRGDVKKFGVILPRIPQAEEAVGAMRAAAARAGVEVGRVALTPLETVDFAPAATTALDDGADGVFVFQPGPNQATAIKAVRDRDPDARVGTLNVALDDKVREALGPAGDGVLVMAAAAPISADTPGIAMMRKDLEAHADEPPRSDGTTAHWLAMWMLERVMRESGATTAEELVPALNELQELDMGGIIPPYTTATPGAFPPAPRVFNTSSVVAELRGGEVVLLDPEDPFYDPFAGGGPSEG